MVIRATRSGISCAGAWSNSGSTRPSAANQEAFDRAVHEIAHVTQHLLDELVTSAPPKNREAEAEKARARAALRYGT